MPFRKLIAPFTLTEVMGIEQAINDFLLYIILLSTRSLLFVLSSMRSDCYVIEYACLQEQQWCVLMVKSDSIPG